MVMHPCSYTWRGAEGGPLTAQRNLTGVSNVSCVVWSVGPRARH